MKVSSKRIKFLLWFKRNYHYEFALTQIIWWCV